MLTWLVVIALDNGGMHFYDLGSKVRDEAPVTRQNVWGTAIGHDLGFAEPF